MKTQNINKSEVKILRQRAEEELKNRKSTSLIHEVDNLKLIHELQVHQIELEMQNEELAIAIENAELARGKYLDLYDFAPSGYLTISEEGNITELNYTAANLLGSDRIHLKNTQFVFYIAPESMDTFNQLIDKVFIQNKKVSCELKIISKNNDHLVVLIDAIISPEMRQCLINMIDISERDKMESELQKTAKDLKDMNSYFLSREIRMVDLKMEINKLLIKSGCEKEYLI